MRIASASVFVAALITLGIAFVMLQNRLATIRKWKPVNAQVTRAWMEEHKSTGDDGSDVFSYSANYELTYDIEGKSIRSTARSNDPLLTDAAAVQPRLARHAPGTRGIVHVNPDDPAQMRLNLGKNVVTLGLPMWLLLAGVSLLLFAVSFWFMGTPAVKW